MSIENLRYYHAWDLPTRLLHWINVACVLALAFIGTAILYDKELGVTDAGKVILKTTHVWFGYVFVLNFDLADRLGIHRQPACTMGGSSSVSGGLSK